jgi:hypothetical protein
MAETGIGHTRVIGRLDDLMRERDRLVRDLTDAQVVGRAFRDALVLAQRERDEEQQACDRLRALLREARNYLGDDADLNARIDAALGKQDG